MPPEQLNAANQETPEPPAGQDPTRTASAISKAKAFWSAVHDNIGVIPLLAPLLVAGYYQADLARTALQWEYPWVVLFPLSIEAGAAWAAGNYHRKLVAGDSTIGARMGMLAYAGSSGALLFWHARDTHRPLATALAVSGMTLAAMWIWTQRAKHAKRDVLRARGLVDKQVPRFSAPRWILCPVETARTFRWAVRHSVDDPAEALSRYRDRDQDTNSQDTPPPKTKATSRIRRKPTPEHQDPPVLASIPSTPKAGDQDLLRALKDRYPSWQNMPPSLNDIRAVLDEGKSSDEPRTGQTRASRFQQILIAESGQKVNA